MPPSRFPIGPILEDPQVAPPYCDLYVQQLVPGKIDHENRQVHFAAVIGNRGVAPPAGPIRTEFTVLVDWHSPYGVIQETIAREWRWYQVSALPFRTMWMNAPLHYAEEGFGQYHLYVMVGDPDNLAGDDDVNNNWRTMDCPAMIKPATFNETMQGALRFESTIDGENVTTALTLDGKPLKTAGSTRSARRTKRA